MDSSPLPRWAVGGVIWGHEPSWMVLHWPFDKSQHLGLSPSHLRKWKMGGKVEGEVLEPSWPSKPLHFWINRIMPICNIYSTRAHFTWSKYKRPFTSTGTHDLLFGLSITRRGKYIYLLRNILCEPLKHSAEPHLEFITKVVLCRAAAGRQAKLQIWHKAGQATSTLPVLFCS